MSVPTLKNTALYSIVQHVWYNSKLRSLTLSRAYKSRSYGSDSYQAQKINTKIEELTKSLCDKIAALKNVPKILKAYMAIALSNTEEINWFIDKAIESMVVVSKVKLQVLVNRIKLTPNGFLNKRNCLLSTIEDSQFRVNFNKEFLLKNGIGKEELLKIADRIVSNEKSEPRRIIKQKHIDEIQNYPSLGAYFEKLTDFDEDTPEHFYGRSVMEILIYKSAWDLLPHYLNTVDPSERDMELSIAADFVFENMVILMPEIFVFLYENMREETWNEYVAKQFEKVVGAFLGSWRHMHLIVGWFPIAVKDDDKTRFLRALRKVIEHLKYEKYEKPLLCEIIKNIWINTSKTLTNDKEVMEVVLGALITQETKEFNLLEFILRTYDTEIQKTFIIKTLFCTLTEAKNNKLDDLTQVITNLGFDIQQIKENLTYDVVKEILINEYSIKNKKVKDFDKILGFFDLKIETTNFKDLILMETDYVAKILDTFWFDKNLTEFLIWLNHNSKQNCAKFISNLYTNGIIEKVYEKVVMDIGEFDHIKDVDLDNRFSLIHAMMNGHIGAADEGLENLKLTISEKNTIKKAVLLKPEVQKHILICYFRTECMYDITKEWNLFINDDIESGKKFFTEMLLTEGGKAAILDLVLYCRKMETVYRYEEQIKFYSKLRKKFFDKYELNSVVDEVLREHGHPNARGDAIQFEGREPKNDEETFIGKVIVDFKYRTLRAILNSPTPCIHYNKKTVGFFGDLSHKLARRVGLNIPEVK